VGVRIGPGPAVRASGTAGRGTSAQRFVNDGLEGARASATFGAAAEAAIDLLGTARQVFRGADGTADIVVGQDVTGTNNHENGQTSGVMQGYRYLRLRRDAKGKTIFLSDSKLIPGPGWNEFKKQQPGTAADPSPRT
jgi:hypothetical protein